MKKETKEMLKLIISNQELIMKALKIELPVVEGNEKKSPAKQADLKKPVKKAAKKK